MPLTPEACTNLLELLFKNTDWANVGDAAGLQNSAAAGSFYISLHTATPAAGNDQTTSECAYTGYARVAVARSGAGFTVAAANASNTAAVTFGKCTGAAPETATHFGIGTAASGAGHLIGVGTLSTPLVINVNITPDFAIGELDCNAT